MTDLYTEADLMPLPNATDDEVPLILGLSGYAGSGKDTVAGILYRLWRYQRLAFADTVREAVYRLNPIVMNHNKDIVRVREYVDGLGWDEAKQHPEVRRLLQVFGTEVGRALIGEDVWVNLTLAQVVLPNRYVITDVRFPNEAYAVRECGGALLRVERPEVNAVNDHISDNALDDFDFDGYILNDGSLADLEATVFLAVKELM